MEMASQQNNVSFYNTEKNNKHESCVMRIKEYNKNILQSTATLLLTILLTILFVLGCEGPQGPQGLSSDDLGDVIPPYSVKIIKPLRSTKVTFDRPLLEIQVDAHDEEGTILYVEFILDNSSVMGNVTAHDSIHPFIFNWDMSVSHQKEFGIYPLIGRAYDLNMNFSDSAPININYADTPTDEYLSYHEEGVDTSFALPNDYGDRYYNVRFSPRYPCTLAKIEFDFIDPTLIDSLAGGCDIRIFIWHSQGDTIPAPNPIDSLFIDFDDLEFDAWTAIDSTMFDVPEFTEDFHAGFSVATSADYETLLGQSRAMAIAATRDTTYTDDPIKHRSSEYYPHDDTPWNTLWDHTNIKYDFHIRAYVVYDNGEEAVLSGQFDPAISREN
jgi:hypothetical protein